MCYWINSTKYRWIKPSVAENGISRVDQANAMLLPSQIARFMAPTWGPPGSWRPQMGPWWPHEPCYQRWLPHLVTNSNNIDRVQCAWVNFNNLLCYDTAQEWCEKQIWFYVSSKKNQLKCKLRCIDHIMVHPIKSSCMLSSFAIIIVIKYLCDLSIRFLRVALLELELPYDYSSTRKIAWKMWIRLTGNKP